MSDDTFDRTILSLKILGRIREQDRLYSCNGLDVSGPSKLDCIYRTFHGENRTQNINDVRDVLSTAFTLIDSLLTKEESDSKLSNHTNTNTRRRKLEQTRTQQKLNHLQEGLEEACKGIQNLSRTYQDDIKTVQLIENIVRNIRDHLQQIEISKQIIGSESRNVENADSTKVICYKCLRDLHSGDENSPCMESPLKDMAREKGEFSSGSSSSEKGKKKSSTYDKK